ncbi:MAG: hypothetical protein ACOYL9_14855, partial [Ilumatobacteraceae bacterium]
MRGLRSVALGAAFVLMTGCGSGDQGAASETTADPVTETVPDATTTVALAAPPTSAPGLDEVRLTEQCAQPAVAIVTEALRSIQMQSFEVACMAPGVAEQLAALKGGNWQYEVEPTAPAGSEPVERGPWLQWHVDAFTVPPGATELARSPAG